MIEENIFMPRILLCGDKEEFFSHVGQRMFDLIGQIKFFDEKIGLNFPRDEKFLLNNDLIGQEKLADILRTRADFIVFNDYKELEPISRLLYKLGCPRSQVVTLLEFNNLPTDGFYDTYSAMQLLETLKKISVKTLLDVNAYFVKSYLMNKNVNNSLEIDCIWQGDLIPIKEEFFSHVYKNFSDCALRRYDAALIFENSPTAFDESFSRVSKTVDLVITFCRYGSALEKHIRNTVGNFKEVRAFKTFAGLWLFCYVKKMPEDFAMYVVTHKALPSELLKKFPEGYKIIHAGHALGKEFGYPGDDTGENISDLNPYINEMTALYWMWKNTSNTIVGLSHYRRFFTANNKNFLTSTEASDILKNHDIIVGNFYVHSAPSQEILASHEIMGELANSKDWSSFAARIIRKNLMRTHPDYLDIFDYKMNLPTAYLKNMFVARRPVFDAYCEWLFSFIVDSTREVLEKTPLAKLDFSERRLMGHFAERMLTVWLMKNHLRIKKLLIVEAKFQG